MIEIYNSAFYLYDYVPIGICIIDKEYRIKCWNKCLRGWTGIKQEELLGKNLLEIYPHLQNPVYKLRIDLMFNGHPPTLFSSLLHKYFFPIENFNKDFQIQSATLTSIPTNNLGEFDTLIAIENQTKLTERVKNYRQMKDQALVEIEKRKLAESDLSKYAKKLEEINATKDKFFSIIAHDLKNPFSGFLGLTQLLAKEMPNFSLEELHEFGKNLNKSASNLNKLLENLLDWARMQNGTMKFSPDICVLNYLVKQNINITKESAAKKNISIEYDVPTEVTVLADVSMLNSVFRNIISNAIKFTPIGGKVEIGLIDNGDPDFLTVFIKDSGIGMDEYLMDRLFKIDQKVSRPGTEGESSTGLGLLLCKEFIDKHECKIWVESKIYHGTVFYFTVKKNKY